MSMTMKYEFITPEKAAKMLEKNSNNRSVSKGTVEAYANDIKNGNWDESVGAAISVDENGIVRDGQHRLCAIIRANAGIHTWICRGVSSDGLYDNNRKRSTSDQIRITRRDLEKVYSSNRYIAVAKALIQRGTTRRMVSPKEILDFTDAHKADLDGFFLKMSSSAPQKTSVATVWTALYMAYCAGVSMGNIFAFYDILTSGMSTRPEEFPVIAYRNYLISRDYISSTISEISRCQYALKKYLTGSCTRQNKELKELIYPFPYGGKDVQ